MLRQFGIMGSIYMKRILGIESPRVGLANIGAEPTKGTKPLVEAFEYLSSSDKINFVGNIEPKILPESACDVLVCDGFTGNMILKTTEGAAKYLLGQIKSVLYSTPVTKLASLTMKRKLYDLKASLSASQYGGAPMLGISKPVLKAHGSSTAEDIRNAVKQAIAFKNTGLIVDISNAVLNDRENENE